MYNLDNFSQYNSQKINSNDKVLLWSINTGYIFSILSNINDISIFKIIAISK